MALQTPLGLRPITSPRVSYENFLMFRSSNSTVALASAPRFV